MLPGWYGFGAAVDAWLAEPTATRRSRCCAEMHARWPFFRSVLSNMAMVLAKTDLAIASRYAELVPDVAVRDAIFRHASREHAAHDSARVSPSRGSRRCWTTTRRSRAASATASRTSTR